MTVHANNWTELTDQLYDEITKLEAELKVAKIECESTEKNMTIHTEVHYINEINKIYTANQEGTQVILRRYNNPDDYAINLCREFRLPYEFLEEILRVKKPT